LPAITAPAGRAAARAAATASMSIIAGGQTGGGDLGEPCNLSWKSNSGVRNQTSPPRAAKGVEKDARWKSPKAGLSHRAWESSKRRWIPTFPTPSTAAGMWGNFVCR